MKDEQDVKLIYDRFLNDRAEHFGINIEDKKLKKAITRVCLMMRLYKKDDIKEVVDEIYDQRANYEYLIDELNETGYDDKSAILLYYSPATLNNTYSFYRRQGVENPIRETLKTCLPFMENVYRKTREEIDTRGNGVITVMLREAALLTSEDPTQLKAMDLDVLNEHEAVVQNSKNYIKQKNPQ